MKAGSVTTQNKNWFFNSIEFNRSFIPMRAVCIATHNKNGFSTA
jgi:hypothetical protein